MANFSGEVGIIIGNEHTNGKWGDTFFVPVRCPHKIINSNKNKKLHIIELQLGSVLSEEDIVRL